MGESEEEKLRRLQLGLAQTSTLFRGGCALLALPFLIVALVVLGLIFYAIVSAMLGF